ncbi:hypothetical protein EW026_g3689 [Hermanssonia centrifuga]|uniref:DUF6533 domain-containing protein n=1 Tax=Hermanssonia centrifuga TaxID=98765 RepID=A0A4V3XAK0_9APHY|nr:hypothetical protein EW026_g3689 [Hermanssonia centrifuga]
MSDASDILPPSLDLPPHLSAQKYFFVCTLTVAAWDTLVLSPRSWRLFRTKGWPFLKIAYHFLRIFMPVEFTIVGVAFFDTKWSQETCSHFFLFEPICTAILLAVCSAVHVIRINAIYDKDRRVFTPMVALYAIQILITAICCGFYRSTPLLIGQGCIAEPKHSWVGIYWISATMLYTASFGLALSRAIRSLKIKKISYWKLMLRDGLNLYAAVFLVNLVNMLFWFIITPTGPEDPIRTIVTSMSAVLTASMTLRIILSVRGTLEKGGSTGPVLSLQQPGTGTFNVPLGATESKTHDWVDDKASDQMGMSEVKGEGDFPVESGLGTPTSEDAPKGVKITIDTETAF